MGPSQYTDLFISLGACVVGSLQVAGGMGITITLSIEISIAESIVSGLERGFMVL